jgi:hypothetical protein
MVLSGKFYNKNKWENQENDGRTTSGTSETLGIRGYRKRAKDREEWMRLLREVKTQKGL